MDIDITEKIKFKFRITEIRKYLNIMCCIMQSNNKITALMPSVFKDDFKDYPELKNTKEKLEEND